MQSSRSLVVVRDDARVVGRMIGTDRQNSTSVSGTAELPRDVKFAWGSTLPFEGEGEVPMDWSRSATFRVRSFGPAGFSQWSVESSAVIPEDGRRPVLVTASGSGSKLLSASNQPGWMASPLRSASFGSGRTSFSAALDAAAASTTETVPPTMDSQLLHGTIRFETASGASSQATAVTRGSAPALLNRSPQSPGGGFRPAMHQPLVLCFDRSVSVGSTSVAL